MASVDPRVTGEALLEARARYGPEMPFHEIADKIPWGAMPQYDPAETLAVSTHKRYHDELQERARGGDRYAISMLLGQTNDDPGGGS